MRKCRLANTSSMPGGHHTDTFCDSIFLHPTNHDSTPMEPRIHEVIEPRIRTSEHRENEQRTRAVQLRPEGRLQGKGHFVARNQARLGRRSFHAGQVDLRKKMVQRLGNEGFLGLRVQHSGVLGWAEPFGAVLSCWRLAGCTRRPRAQRKAKEPGQRHVARADAQCSKHGESDCSSRSKVRNVIARALQAL